MGSSGVDDGAAAVARSVAEVAALAILAVQGERDVERVHRRSLEDGRLI
jgi:hypothetical protein